MFEEKRKVIRIKKSLCIQYRCNIDKGKDLWVVALLRDISEEGMSFTSDKNFLAGDILDVRIKLPSNPFQWVELKCKNVSSRTLSIGIYIIHLQFLDLNGEQKRTIKEYITWILDKEQDKK